VSPDELLNLALLVLTIEAWRAKRAKKKRKAERGVPSQ
jgi:hypothetical protein